MNAPDITAVILAAGKGTRMKSDKAKVLHELFFKPMLHHVLDTVQQAGIDEVAIIVGHQKKQVLESLNGYTFSPVFQEEQLGTGHAVLCAEAACQNAELVMILCGDTPLIRPETLQEMINLHLDSGARLTLMTTLLDEPFGYGRIICNPDGDVLEIVEQKDATPQQRNIKEINAGIYLVDAKFLFPALKQIGTDNSQGEVYLTDIVAIAVGRGHRVQKFTHSPAIDVLGVNSRVELAQAHAELQLRHNQKIMLSGVTMFAPETILLEPAGSIGRDSMLQPGVRVTGSSTLGSEVVLETGAILHNCTLGNQAVIGAYSILQDCTIAPGEHLPPLSVRRG